MYPLRFKCRMTALATLLSVALKQQFDTLTDGVETKLLGADFVEREPEQVGHIVGRRKLRLVFQGAAKEKVGGVHHEVGIVVRIGLREEKLLNDGFGAGLFLHLAQATLLGSLARIDETAGQVERSLGGVESTARHEQATEAVEDDCHCGGRGIVVISKATSATSLGALIVFFKTGRATLRAVPE